MAGESVVDGDERFPIPPLSELVRAARADQPAAAAGAGARVALNTRLLDEDAARRAIEETEAETGLPADDPVRFGAAGSWIPSNR